MQFKSAALYAMLLGSLLLGCRGADANPDQPAKPQSGKGHGKPVTITDATFPSAVLQSKVPVMIDFWAPWCGPCLKIAPAVKELAAEYSGRVTVGKINVDQNKRTSAKYGIRGIPAILIFKDGKVIERIVGLQSKATLKKALSRALES